jgi:hypothetical protein
MELLFSYDENYIPEVDVEGMIGVKKKKTLVRKKERKSCL